jgi:hypothetical protein
VDPAASDLTTLLDDILPGYDAVERHATVVRAPRERTWRALRTADLGRSHVVHALLAVRAVPAALSGCRDVTGPRPGVLTLDDLLRSGFVLLAERPAEEIVFGIVGKFWQASGGVRAVDAAEFRAFEEPGWAKAAWSFSLSDAGGGRTRLATETRVLCTDAASRRRFRAYWLFVRPFSGVIRCSILRTVRDEAERGGAIAR